MPLGEHSMNTHTVSSARVLSGVRERRRKRERERDAASGEQNKQELCKANANAKTQRTIAQCTVGSMLTNVCSVYVCVRVCAFVWAVNEQTEPASVRVGSAWLRRKLSRKEEVRSSEISR